MSQYIFGERTLRARKTYHCDYCHGPIERGDRYTRSIWVIGDHFHMMREHSEPGCPSEEFLRQEEPAYRGELELGVPIVMVLENRLVYKVAINGDLVTETEFTTVFREAPATIMPVFFEEDGAGIELDDDIPF